jgi:hypothetical protein
MPAHFLDYSAFTNNLTPKLTESETVEIIRGHFPANIHCTILSAGVQTICNALNLLNMLELLETDGDRKSNPGPSNQTINTATHSNSKYSNQNRSYRGRPGFENVRNVRYQIMCIYNRNRQHLQSNTRHERAGFSRWGRKDMQDRTMLLPSNNICRNLNPDTNVYTL